MLTRTDSQRQLSIYLANQDLGSLLLLLTRDLQVSEGHLRR
jgi:hypothetical protein